MVKKIVFSLVICLVGLMAFGNASASADTFLAEMGTGKTGTVKTVFEWNETPWLHLHLPETGWTASGSFWKSPGPYNEYFLTATSDVNNDIWVSLDSGIDSNNNPVLWNNIREMGEWSIAGSYMTVGGVSVVDSGSYSLGFTVAPEPISSVLFLMGGVSLVATRLRRKKKNS